MFFTNFLKISLLSILSILLLPTNLFAMNIDKKKPTEKKFKKPIEVLKEIYNEQTNIINSMLGSFRVVGTTYQLTPHTKYQLYKNENKIKGLTNSLLNLHSRIQNTSNNISKILTSSTSQKNEELDKKIKDIKETQEDINKHLQLLKNAKNKNADKILSKMRHFKSRYTKKKICTPNLKKRAITTKINTCCHVYTDRHKPPKAIIRNEKSCSLCDNNNNNNNYGCCLDRKTKITLCTACVIAGVILAVKLLR